MDLQGANMAARVRAARGACGAELRGRGVGGLEDGDPTCAFHRLVMQKMPKDKKPLQI